MIQFLLIILILTSCTDKKNRPEASQQDLRLPGTEGFREISKRAFKIKQSDAEEIRLSNDAIEVTLRSVSSASSDTFSKSVELREFELGRPFRTERSPYPGAVTDDVQCPPSFRPRITKINGPERWFWRAEIYSSSRKTQVCNETDFVLKSVEIITFCPESKKLITVHSHIPKEDTKVDWATWLTTADCEN